ELLRDHPGETSFRTESGDAAGVLVTLSSAAELVIVGARGRGGFLGRLLGSVSTALPAHAHCPTLVVGRRASSETAADGSVVVAVLPAGDEWLYWYPELELSSEVSARRQKQLAVGLDKEAAKLREQFPNLSVSTSVPVGDPTQTLVEISARAQLLVMGTRGRG